MRYELIGYVREVKFQENRPRKVSTTEHVHTENQKAPIRENLHYRLYTMTNNYRKYSCYIQCFK